MQNGSSTHVVADVTIETNDHYTFDYAKVAAPVVVSPDLGGSPNNNDGHYPASLMPSFGGSVLPGRVDVVICLAINHRDP